MTVLEFNRLEEQAAFEELFKCCGSTNWAKQVVAKRPFANLTEIKKVSDEIWNKGTEIDWLEAFTHHPKIGDPEAFKKKFATKEWAANEQAGVQAASTDVIEKLANDNIEYEKRFGFIFIVCATGKSADEMLHLLEQRLPNTPEEEIKIAAEEQNKITHIRLSKLFA